MSEQWAVSEALRSTLAELQDVVFVKDLDGRYLMVNERAAGLMGRSADEMIGTTDEELMPAEMAEQLRRHDEEVLSHGGPLILEEPIVVGGEVREFVTCKQPLRDASGRTIGLIGVSTDMSAQALAEEALRRSGTQLAVAQELTAVGSWEWDVAGDRRSWSPELFRIFGMGPGEEPLSWEGFLELVHPDDRDAVRTAFDEAMASGSRYSMVHRLIRPDGEERILACSARGELDLDGTLVRVIGACQDITERHRDEERRRESEAQLNAAQELTGVGSWEWDLDTQVVTWSANLYRIFGVERDEFGGSYEAYLTRVHPADREKRATSIERVVATGETSRDEYRIVRPDGQVRTIASVTERITAASGAMRLVGAVQDVTELRRSERELTRRMLVDPLTGVGNRTLGYDRLAHALTVAARRDSRVCVLYLDIDGFKAVNDELGHAAGDEALREIGARLAQAVRDSDTLARLGGDEFLVICEDLESDEEGDEVAARVRRCFDEDFEIGGQRRRLAASVGLAFTAHRDVTVDELIGEADAAMYRDKGRRAGS